MRKSLKSEWKQALGREQSDLDRVAIGALVFAVLAIVAFLPKIGWLLGSG